MRNLAIVTRAVRNAGLISALLIAVSPAHAASWVKLGIGQCGTPSGGQGNYSLHSEVTSEAGCLNLCALGKFPCTAIEYNPTKRECEVHQVYIDRLATEPASKATCYVVR